MSQELREPKPFTVTGTVRNSDGTETEKEYHFILTKFNAWDGRELAALYPQTALPKVGDYQENERLAAKLLSYVAVPIEGADPVFLKTRELAANHCGNNWEVMAKVEFAMLEYNCSFFRDGRSWDFLENIMNKISSSVFEMLTNSLAQSSPVVTPQSTNSEPVTL